MGQCNAAPREMELALDAKLDFILFGGRAQSRWPRRRSRPSMRFQALREMVCHGQSRQSSHHCCIAAVKNRISRTCWPRIRMSALLNPLETPPMGEHSTWRVIHIHGRRMASMGNIHHHGILCACGATSRCAAGELEKPFGTPARTAASSVHRGPVWGAT